LEGQAASLETFLAEIESVADPQLEGGYLNISQLADDVTAIKGPIASTRCFYFRFEKPHDSVSSSPPARSTSSACRAAAATTNGTQPRATDARALREALSWKRRAGEIAAGVQVIDRSG
jgi:hypothetical protein